MHKARFLSFNFIAKILSPKANATLIASYEKKENFVKFFQLLVERKNLYQVKDLKRSVLAC